MTPPRLVVVGLLLSALTVPRAHAAGCRHLLVDPAGDAKAMGSAAAPPPVDADSQVDLRWVELASTRKELTATIRVEDLNPEAQRVADHAFQVFFTNAGQRYMLMTTFNRTGDFGGLYHQSGDQDVNGDARGAGVFEGIGDTTTKVDPHADSVRITTDLSGFKAVRPLAGPITALYTVSYSGGSAVVLAAYAYDDDARGARAYRLGDKPCLAR